MNTCPSWSPNQIQDATANPTGQLNIKQNPSDESQKLDHTDGTVRRHSSQSLHEVAAALPGASVESITVKDATEFPLPLQMQAQLQAQSSEAQEKGEMSPYSVLIGRGNEVKNWVGNKRLEVLCQTQLEAYANAKNKVEKSEIVSSIKDMVINAGGSFYKKKPGPGGKVSEETWQLTTRHQAAREKIGSLLRDMLYFKYRSSSKSKVSERRRLRQSSTVAAAAIQPLPHVHQDLHRGQQQLPLLRQQTQLQQQQQQATQHIQDQQLRQLMNMKNISSPLQPQRQVMTGGHALFRTGSLPGYMSTGGGGAGIGGTPGIGDDTHASRLLPISFNARQALSAPVLTGPSSSIAAYASRAEALVAGSAAASGIRTSSNMQSLRRSWTATTMQPTKSVGGGDGSTAFTTSNKQEEEDDDDDDKSQMSDFSNTLLSQHQQLPADESTFDDLF